MLTEAENEENKNSLNILESNTSKKAAKFEFGEKEIQNSRPMENKLRGSYMISEILLRKDEIDRNLVSKFIKWREKPMKLLMNKVLADVKNSIKKFIISVSVIYKNKILQKQKPYFYRWRKRSLKPALSISLISMTHRTSQNMSPGAYFQKPSPQFSNINQRIKLLSPTKTNIQIIERLKKQKSITKIIILLIQYAHHSQIKPISPQNCFQKWKHTTLSTLKLQAKRTKSLQNIVKNHK